MQKVKLLAPYGDRKKGDVAEVDDERARLWVEAGIAKAVK